MGFVDFFIRRPIFASVCSVLIVIAGAVVIPGLPVAQYPQLALPTVNVVSGYIGASSEVVEQAVTQILEQQINGVAGMKYLTSSSGNDGFSNITVTFELDRNVDIAAVDVQNRVAVASSRLPAEVTRGGVTVEKSGSAMILAIGLTAENNEYSDLFISNYADLYIKDSLKRIKGVSDVMIFGERKYAMRLWLDPQRLAARGLTPQDVALALSEQNLQVAAGSVGGNPAPAGLGYQLNVRARGRLTEPAEFEDIIIKRGAMGALVRVKDIGRAELGAESYDSTLRFDGKNAVGFGVFQLPTANALEVERNVRAELARLSKRFPPGLRYDYAFDATAAVRESIKEVIVTLLEAILLVVLVIFVFLQSWRSTLIPAITIPVSLLGTFAFVKLFGFSINTLTLFGLTLATGLVVDDAIVVIENIERFIQDKHMAPLRAASEGMREVTGAVIATSLVLIAVFIPVAFFPGTTGRIYNQFSLTIAFSIALSAFNSLTLTPALSAILLKGHSDAPKRGFFAGFNRGFDALRAAYRRGLLGILRHKALGVGAFAALLVGTYLMFTVVPTGFVPDEDQGFFITIVQAPEGASTQHTLKVIEQIEAKLRSHEEIEHLFSVAGFSFAGNGPNKGIIFTNMKPWEQRRAPHQHASAVLDRVRGELAGINGAMIIPFAPPPVEGVGNFGGFQFVLQDRASAGVAALQSVLDALVGAAARRPELAGVFASFTANDPQLIVEVDRQRAKALDLGIDDVFRTLQMLMGSAYVNDFELGTRTYRVYLQAASEFRDNPRDIEAYYVRSRRGKMIPLGNVVQVRTASAPQTISHFNMFRSADVSGSPAPGYSSGEALRAMEEVAKQTLPAGFGFEWTGLSKEQLESGNQTLFLFALGLVVVFLVLAAQYESLSLPFVVMFSVPLALLGALLAQQLRGLANDVFCQVGLVMLIGLAAKNGILIVEFAAQLRARGASITDAAVEAAETRLRPILMTSLAFLLGVVPLVIADGAGSAARRSLGTAVFGGMALSTVLNLLFIPLVYVIVESARGARPQGDLAATPPEGA